MMKMQIFLLIIIISLQNISAQTPGTKKWEFQTGGGVNSSPAIGPDGTVYFVSQDSMLYAVRPDGTMKWEIKINVYYGNSNNTPAIASDGTIYVRSDGGELYAVNPDGSKKWDFQGGEGGTASLAVASDGTVYFVSSKLYAINPDGTIKWKFTNAGGSPIIGTDGTIYIGHYAINPDGTQKFELQIGGTSPVINSDGTIYISNGNYLYAINPDGTIKWKFYIPDAIESSPAIGSDGTIYIGLWKSIYAINQDGTKKWEFETGYSVDSSPAIGSDSTIYIGSGDSLLYALNPDGTKKWTFKTNGPLKSSPVIASDGTVYIGSYSYDNNDGSLYAIYSESAGLADSPWPKYRKNNQNIANSYNENCPQAVVAENFISVKNGGEVTLDGSQSFDPDGEPLNYLWCIAEQSPGSPNVLTDSTSEIIKVNITQGIYATYRFALTITDNDDGYSSASVEVSTQKKWEFQTNEELISSPAIGADGMVYISSGSYNNDARLYAINSNGTKYWVFQNTDDSFTSPAIGPDGTVYIVSDSASSWGVAYRRLNAVKPDGTKKWEFKTSSGYVGSSVAIASDGTVYVTSGKLYAINPDGTQKWTLSLGNWYMMTSPVIAADSTIYIGTSSGWKNQDGKLYAVNPDGTLKWSVITWGIDSAPAIGTDGTVYVVDKWNDGHNPWSYSKFYAINSDSTIKWKFNEGNDEWGYSSPVIGFNETVYIGSDSLYAINPDGTRKWASRGSGGYPTIGADGTIYIRGYAINPDGTLEWEIHANSYYNSSPAIASDGTIYFSTDDGKLYALYSDSRGLADSPWPKYRHDNQNTGNFNSPIIDSINEKETIAPIQYALFPMYPNPFNPITHVKFSLPKPGKVQINVYNILGQNVAKLLNAKKTAGTYDVIWDASHFASGMYFIRLESGKFVKIRKCLLIK